ncbi:MAG: bifunctional glutamate--cysteine ligase GshA/glutathione synthetase GshB [Campylobacteraceae bacterium]|nr:bifunctional glutamate--cysteine ligase GshA/glutathione synthetase GshB [Campylobacteraceae bacterium]
MDEKNYPFSKIYKNALIGLERESLRVDENGKMSQAPHLKSFKDSNPYIQTDFAQNQVEIITPPKKSVDELFSYLKASHQIVSNSYKDEFLWSFSTPGTTPKESDIKIAKKSNAEAYKYRKYLAKKYGKLKQLMCGIHYNFSFDRETLDEIYADEPNKDELINELYMKLARNYMRYRYILTCFLGATPFAIAGGNKDVFRSFRQSPFGYKNLEKIDVSYESLDAYKKSIKTALKKGQISFKQELYVDVRIRYEKERINYIEFRNFDLNPFEPYGINRDDIEFIKLFIVLMAFLPEKECKAGDELQDKTTLGHPFSECVNLSEAKEILNSMRELSAKLGKSTNLAQILDEKEKALDNPKLTLAGKVLTLCKNKDEFLEFGLSLARKHKEIYSQNPYSLHGFETLELSTQSLIKTAISRGIGVEILDRSQNIIKLSYDDAQEILKSANMSSKDSLISYFIMQNKSVTKKILSENGINTPKSLDFAGFDEALEVYDEFDKLVIKPQNTNYGLGITIFEEKPSFDNFREALTNAFSEDSVVLIEEFVKGEEYRFYVQDDKVLAISKREPPKVVGDGKSTISELIDILNQDPQRKDGHIAPMCYVKKNEPVKLWIESQGFSFDSVLEAGQEITLRKNSNVSTGGISIDKTDEIDEFYKDIAIKSAKALKSRICGIDMIINEKNYAVIEANFNPAMMIHLFPKIGKSRDVATPFLEMLFGEI